MFWTLVLAAAVAGSHSAGIDFLTNGKSTRNDPEGWMAQLRGQLMQDNYDYEPSSDEPGLLPGLLDEEAEPPSALREGAAPREQATWLDQHEIDDEPATIDSRNAPDFRNHPDDSESEMKQNTRGSRRHGVSQQDLLYYVDNAWLHRDDDDNDDNDDRRADRDNNELSSGDSGHSDGRRAFETTATTKIYKLLKVPWAARRDGLGARFVEERSAQGVALLSLDGAPFPSFRLPSERRQYQEIELD